MGKTTHQTMTDWVDGIGELTKRENKTLKRVLKPFTEKVELEEALKPKDKKVVDSFYDEKKDDQPKATLSTDGKTLWIGGSKAAEWKNGKIEILHAPTGQYDQSVFKYMRKSIPKLNFAKEEVEIDEAVNLKKLKKEYEKNEDKNYHTENYLLLAKAFGTPAEVKKVEEILKKEQKQGQGSKVDFDWMYKNINPYYKKLRNEEVEMDEAKGTAYPATIDTLRKIVKDKQNQVVMFDKGQARVDTFTASAIIAVYDGLKKSEHKKTLEDMIKTKEGFLKTQAFAMKMVK